MLPFRVLHDRPSIPQTYLTIGFILRNAKLWVSVGAVFVFLSVIFSGWLNPPGTMVKLQLDPVYHPTAILLIRNKTRGESWLLRSRGVVASKGFSYAPRGIELKCESPINALLVDLSNVSTEEIAAIQTTSAARRNFSIDSKKLLDYPRLGELKNRREAKWSVRRWSWKPTLWKLVIECPSNPQAMIEVRIDYGGSEWEEIHG